MRDWVVAPLMLLVIYLVGSVLVNDALRVGRWALRKWRSERLRRGVIEETARRLVSGVECDCCRNALDASIRTELRAVWVHCKRDAELGLWRPR